MSNKGKRHSNSNKTHWPYINKSQFGHHINQDSHNGLGTPGCQSFSDRLVPALPCDTNFCTLGHLAVCLLVIQPNAPGSYTSKLSVIQSATTVIQWDPLVVMQLVIHHRQMGIQLTTGISGALLLPSMHVGHVKIEVPHTGEGVAS